MENTLRNQVYHYLTEDGKGGGETHAIDDYTSAPTRFHISYENRSVAISFVSIFIEDETAFDATNYGAKTALVNGISLNVRDPDNNVAVDFNGGQTIKTNSDWSRIGASVILYAWGQGNQFMTVRGGIQQYDEEGVARPLVIPAGFSFGLDLSDDFTGLVEHSFKVTGYGRR